MQDAGTVTEYPTIGAHLVKLPIQRTRRAPEPHITRQTVQALKVEAPAQ